MIGNQTVLKWLENNTPQLFTFSRVFFSLWHTSTAVNKKSFVFLFDDSLLFCHDLRTMFYFLQISENIVSINILILKKILFYILIQQILDAFCILIKGGISHKELVFRIVFCFTFSLLRIWMQEIRVIFHSGELR